MSSPDFRLSRRSVLVGLGASMSLAGCGLSPVHAPNAGGGRIVDELQQVYVSAPEDRVEQVVYNEVLFAFGQNPATSLTAAAYRLDLVSNASIGSSIVSRGGDVEARTLDLSTSFFIRAIGEDFPLFRGSAVASSPYDSPLNQQFADQRAEIDAENRAAREVARQVVAQVSAYFSSNPRPVAPSKPAVPQKQD